MSVSFSPVSSRYLLRKQIRNQIGGSLSESRPDVKGLRLIPEIKSGDRVSVPACIKGRNEFGWRKFLHCGGRLGVSTMSLPMRTRSTRLSLALTAFIALLTL